MKKTILIIDQPDTDKELLEHHLNDSYSIIHKTTVSDAMTLLDSQQRIDAIIADISISGVTSTDFVSLTKQKYGKRLPPVIVYTSTHQPVETHPDAAELTSGHILTPIHLHEIKNKLDTVLGINGEIDQYIERLETSNHELRQFAVVASHDLREPLRMVSTYVKLMQLSMGDLANETQKQFMQLAMDGAERMERMINDLLCLATLDQHPKIEDIVLNDIISDINWNLQILLDERNAKIISDGLTTIRGDKTLITQLFQNLISNGIKYNESKEPTVTITCEDQGTMVEICVSDNGIGIPEKYKENVFKVFQRAPGARQYQGAGIGLAICQKIIDTMNGSISIHDNPNGGTLFKIEIPNIHAYTQSRHFFWHQNIGSAAKHSSN